MHENFTLSSVRKFKMQPPHTYKKRKVEKRTSFILEKVGGGHWSLKQGASLPSFRTVLYQLAQVYIDLSSSTVLHYHLLGQYYTTSQCKCIKISQILEYFTISQDSPILQLVQACKEYSHYPKQNYGNIMYIFSLLDDENTMKWSIMCLPTYILENSGNGNYMQCQCIKCLYLDIFSRIVKKSASAQWMDVKIRSESQWSLLFWKRIECTSVNGVAAKNLFQNRIHPLFYCLAILQIQACHSSSQKHCSLLPKAAVYSATTHTARKDLKNDTNFQHVEVLLHLSNDPPKSLKID